MFRNLLRHPRHDPRLPLCGASRVQDRWTPVHPAGPGRGSGGGALPAPPGGGGPLAGDGGHPGRPGHRLSQLVRPSGPGTDPAGGHRDQRKDHHHLSAQGHAGGVPPRKGGADRHQPEPDRGGEPARPPHHAGVLRGAGAAAGDGGCGVYPRGDGGILPRPGAPPPGRHPLPGGYLHQSDPGPPGLPRYHGGLPGRQGAAVPPVRRCGAQPGRRGGPVLCRNGAGSDLYLLGVPGRGGSHGQEPPPVPPAGRV